ncbi:MAG: hypothetical protein LUD17_01195 [Bacteroidales bacterium]|nr:hypothetical protein [Bacteroidales bacterium]
MDAIATTLERIERVSIRGYERRFSLMAPGLSAPKAKSSLSRLNTTLESLYDQLYEEIYPLLDTNSALLVKSRIAILNETLSLLYQQCKALPSSININSEIDRLDANLSAFLELEADIQCYKINAPTNKVLQSSMNRLASMAL